MSVYLVQHAEARPKVEDPERHLTDQGKADIEKVAAFIVENTTLKVKRILHSGKARAQQTAEVLAKYLNPSDGVSSTEGLEPLAEPSIWADRLADTKEELMLVGHLPHLDKLAAKLVCQNDERSVVTFRMGGIVCLGRDDSKNWTVRWMITPFLLK
ncbi:MAG: phosphohistidine phosphatase SixA [Candidatus Zixiibacteriota bacterium]